MTPTAALLALALALGPVLPSRVGPALRKGLATERDGGVVWSAPSTPHTLRQPVEESPPPPPPPLPAAPVASDSLRPAPPPPVLDVYRADPDFQYDRPEAEGPSLWTRFWDWVRRTVWDPLTESTSAGFRETVLVLLAVLALGWAVSRLLRAEGSGVFGRGERRAPSAGPLLDAEAIAEVDLGARLRAALAAGDHREAVRVRYLLLLQALDAAGAIAWRRDKTNRQYVAEVRASAPDRAAAFARATRAFDAVWYGERPVSTALFGRLAPVFEEAAAPVPA